MGEYSLWTDSSKTAFDSERDAWTSAVARRLEQNSFMSKKLRLVCRPRNTSNHGRAKINVQAKEAQSEVRRQPSRGYTGLPQGNIQL